MPKIALIVAVLFLASGCDPEDSCQIDSPKAKRFLALSETEHAEFHKRAVELLKSLKESERARSHISAEDVPKYFREKGVIVISVFPHTTRFRLQGCMDHHLDIDVNQDLQTRELWLVGGEHTDYSRIRVWSDDV